MLECVIFDLDGQMIDSEPLQFQAYREAFAHFHHLCSATELNVGALEQLLIAA